MADYTPVFLPGLAITAVAAGTIVGGDPLEVAGTGTVQKCTSASPKYVGVAGSGAASGQNVTYFAARVVFDGLAEGGIELLRRPGAIAKALF